MLPLPASAVGFTGSAEHKAGIILLDNIVWVNAKLLA